MLLRTTIFAFAVALLSLATAPVQAAATGRKPVPDLPLGMAPATIDYLANDAPFVVFDVSPRRLPARPGAAIAADTVLSFVATDVLSWVRVTSFARSARQGTRDTQVTACGQKMAGYHLCQVPVAQAFARLEGDTGTVGLRIEAEGLDGGRSLVQITLPAEGMRPRTQQPVPVPAPSAPALSLLAAPPPRR